MRPNHYSVFLKPDLEQLTFEGSVCITGVCASETAVIELDAKNLKIFSVQVGKKENMGDAEYLLIPEKEKIKITPKYPCAGETAVFCTFSGELNDMLLGFYRSRYEVEGKIRYMATTQFEEREARATFPCFDHPSLKATFDIQMMIPENLTAIANTPIVKEELSGEGLKTVYFERTPPMCTYVLYFGAGFLESIEDHSKKPIMRIITTPGKIGYADFALDMARKSMNYGEEYTGIPFPIGKCDHIGVADFAFGAMENYGAITYRENYLMVIPGVTPKPVIARIAQIIAHETIHMWFGNLVSPADWKYIWLNESFASYFTYAIPDKYFPSWDSWDSFIIQTQRGLTRDALNFSLPIELEDGEELLIDPSSAPIIYSKGAAIIRVLNGYLGESNFRKGVQHFLTKFQYGNATSNDYWTAFEEATGEPIKEFADSWVYQMGYPVITVERNENRLNLSQNRFTYLEGNSDALWFIPVKIWIRRKDGTIQIDDLIMKDREMVHQIPDDTILFKLNHDQTGFYRVKYTPQELENLGKAIRDKNLPALDRFGIADDLMAFVYQNSISVDDFILFIYQYYMHEDSYLALDAIVLFFNFVLGILRGDLENARQVATEFSENALERIGMEPKNNDSVNISDIRSKLLILAYLAGSVKIRPILEQKFEVLINGKEVDPDLYLSAVIAGAKSHPGALKWFKSQIEDLNLPETQHQSILSAMGNFEDEQQLRSALQMNLELVPKRNRYLIFSQTAVNSLADSWLLEYFIDNYPILQKELPDSILANSLVAVIPKAGRFYHSKAAEFLENLMMRDKRIYPTAKMVRELLDVYTRFN